VAVTQSKIGRLDPAIRDRALAAIDRGGDLSVWAIDNPQSLARRKQVLAKVREQLTGPQPARSRVQRRSTPSCGLAAGDVLALDFPGGSPYCELCGFTSTGRVKLPVFRNCSSAEPICHPWKSWSGWKQEASLRLQ